MVQPSAAAPIRKYDEIRAKEFTEELVLGSKVIDLSNSNATPESLSNIVDRILAVFDEKFKLWELDYPNAAPIINVNGCVGFREFLSSAYLKPRISAEHLMRPLESDPIVKAAELLKPQFKSFAERITHQFSVTLGLMLDNRTIVFLFKKTVDPVSQGVVFERRICISKPDPELIDVTSIVFEKSSI